MGRVMTRSDENRETPSYLVFRVIPQVSLYHPIGLITRRSQVQILPPLLLGEQKNPQVRWPGGFLLMSGTCNVLLVSSNG